MLPSLLLSSATLCTTLPSKAQDEGTGPAVIAADPQSGSKVTSLSVIELTLDQEMDPTIWEYEMESAELPAIFGAPSNVKATLWYGREDYKSAKITIEPELTQDGTYEITVPEGHFWNAEWEMGPACKLVYTIGTGSSGEEPVQYDVNYTSIDPAPGTYERFETITLTFDSEVFPAPDARAWLYQNDMVYKGVPMESKEGNKIDILFENFNIEGSYELVIDKGSIGDATWLESPHLGHSNPEYRIPGYTIKQTESKLVYDFLPTLNPEDKETVTSLERIKLNFEGTWCNASEEPIVIYDYKDDEYPLTVSMGDVINEAVLSLSTPITENGQYRLLIPKGRFGNSDFEETSGEEGSLNPEILVEYNVNTTNGIDEITDKTIGISVEPGVLMATGNGVVTVWSMQGMKVAETEVCGNASMELLPGIYLVKTPTGVKKVNIK